MKILSFVRNLRQIYLVSNDMQKKLDFLSYFFAYRIVSALKHANHQEIEQLSEKLIKRNQSLGYFYLAESLALRNQLDNALLMIKKFLKNNPHSANGTYLLVDLENRLGNKIVAKKHLIELLQHSKRRKTWQILSDLVESSEDFIEYEQLFGKYFRDYKHCALPVDLISHFSNAAIRGNNEDFALNLWRTQYELVKNSNIKHKNKTTKKFYNDSDAAFALSALKKCLNESNITFFLISGTLLGCVRENKLLQHDKDIDVGVWDTQTIQQLVDVFRNSGCFYVLPIYSPHIVVVRHVNGITIDVFIHYRESNDYWHAGGKSKWHNTPFRLKEHYFLGEYYLIPEDYNTYLTENYGDWRIPNFGFDATLAAPNVEIVDDILMKIYKMKKFIVGYI